MRLTRSRIYSSRHAYTPVEVACQAARGMVSFGEGAEQARIRIATPPDVSPERDLGGVDPRVDEIAGPAYDDDK